MKNILIVGYGVVGQNVHQKIKNLNPDICDIKPEISSTVRDIKYDITFICTDTISIENHELDLHNVEEALQEHDSEIYVIKSTCPIGTVERLKKETGKRIVSSPEFYGNTQHCNNFNFDFTILGGSKEDCVEIIQALQNCFDARHQFKIVESKLAEIEKFMENSYLATIVTFCNQFYDICNKHGVNYEELRELFILDPRVNPSHTFVYRDKPYWDSHCLNKDVSHVAYHEDAKFLIDMCKFNEKRKK